jgi:hypothetical protein
MFFVSLFRDCIHYLIFQTEQNISKLDFILFSESWAIYSGQATEQDHLSHLTTTGPCLWVASQVDFAYMINEPSVSDI